MYRSDSEYVEEVRYYKVPRHAEGSRDRSTPPKVPRRVPVAREPEVSSRGPSRHRASTSRARRAPGPGTDEQLSHYREKTRHYPVGNDGPHVMSVDLGTSTRTRRKGKQPERAPSPTLMSIDSPSTELRLISQNDPDFIPDAAPFIRDVLGWTSDIPISLDSLIQPRPGQKPDYPYPILVQIAIYSSPQKRLTLSEICATLERKFEWFSLREHKKKWKVSATTTVTWSILTRH